MTVSNFIFKPIFKACLNGNDRSPHMRCKIKLCRYGCGTLISAEIANGVPGVSKVYISNESIFEVNITDSGYGFCAVFLPCPPYRFLDCPVFVSNKNGCMTLTGIIQP